MSRSSTITDSASLGDPSNWLHNAHVGEHLLLDFLEPLDLSAAELAGSIGTDPDAIAAVVEGTRRLDGELDLRLARYFGMSEGFFLRLQISHELLEAKRALSGELDRIIPRAA